jgi:hypothetical protein
MKPVEVALPLPGINDASAYNRMPDIGPHPKGIGGVFARWRFDWSRPAQAAITLP